jgi:hypothetical protein
MIRVGILKRIAIVLGLALATPAFLAVGGLATAHVASAQSMIEVRGNQRVDADTIRSYFRVAPGERIDAVKIDEALKALYATGLYEDVRITQSGGRIIVTVVENQTINRVAFEGNRKVKNDTRWRPKCSRARAARFRARRCRPTCSASSRSIGGRAFSTSASSRRSSTSRTTASISSSKSTKTRRRRCERSFSSATTSSPTGSCSMSSRRSARTG